MTLIRGSISSRTGISTPTTPNSFAAENRLDDYKIPESLLEEADLDEIDKESETDEGGRRARRSKASRCEDRIPRKRH